MLTRIRTGKSVLQLPDRQVIFSQGDSAQWLFYVQAGIVKLTAVSDSGKEVIVSLLGAGQFFGEVSLMSGQPRFTTGAIAFGTCIIVRLEKGVVARLLRRSREFSQRFLEHLLAQHVRAHDDLIDQRVNPAEKRLARLLLSLANLHQGGACEALLPKLSQETLAQMIGADRSRVSIYMNRFKRLGLISYGRELRVYESLRQVLSR